MRIQEKKRRLEILKRKKRRTKHLSQIFNECFCVELEVSIPNCFCLLFSCSNLLCLKHSSFFTSLTLAFPGKLYIGNETPFETKFNIIDIGFDDHAESSVQAVNEKILIVLFQYVVNRVHSSLGNCEVVHTMLTNSFSLQERLLFHKRWVEASFNTAINEKYYKQGLILGLSTVQNVQAGLGSHNE